MSTQPVTPNRLLRWSARAAAVMIALLAVHGILIASTSFGLPIFLFAALAAALAAVVLLTAGMVAKIVEIGVRAAQH